MAEGGRRDRTDDGREGDESRAVDERPQATHGEAATEGHPAQVNVEDLTMTAQDVLAALREADAGNVADRWDASMACIPEGGLPFLDADTVREACRWACLDADTVDELLVATEAIEADAALRRLCWHANWRTFECPDRCPLTDWPTLNAALGDRNGCFYMLVGLDMITRMRRFHAERGIPEDVTRDTARQLRCYCDHTYRRGHDGRTGIYTSQLNWLRHYTREVYVRLGRFEYWLGPSPYSITVLRHRETGVVAAIAPDGVDYGPEGYPKRSDGGDADQGWTARVTVDDASTRGCLIHPDGMALRTEVVLPHADWDTVLRRDDDCLMLHIPSGGRMTPEACHDSFQRAREFFRRHFPTRRADAVVCTSWIFGNPLQAVFPPTSNLVRFQRELYLFPVPSSPHAGLWFVFLQHRVDPKTAPRDTGLQRALLDFIESGGQWRHGGMAYLLDDCPSYGQQAYRNAWPRLLEILDL